MLCTEEMDLLLEVDPEALWQSVGSILRLKGVSILLVLRCKGVVISVHGLFDCSSLRLFLLDIAMFQA